MIRAAVLAAAALACAVLSTAADPGGRAIDRPVAGARSLGDPLLPQLGNGGYDVEHYTIEIDYDPVANRFVAATTTISATARQPLKELSFDFQDDLTVSAVEVNGEPARSRVEAARPQLSPDPAVTQPMKLVVTPDPPSRPRSGMPFTVIVEYSGSPRPITDPDGTIEGWIPACHPLEPPRTCDGAYVVGEPMGAQSWFPANNHPSDKAAFDTILTVPVGKTALAAGELVSRVEHGNGTATWHWREDDPTATYLVTATVGDFDFTVGSTVEKATRRRLPVYTAVDASATRAQRAAIDASLAIAPGQLDFLSARYGPYPFDSTGTVADRAAGVWYALEVQTKPHFAGDFDTGDPSIPLDTQLHEIAHQWWGNSVTPRAWNDLWFGEGWVTWSTWHWEHLERGGRDPAAIFDHLYASTPAEEWSIAPAVLDGYPALLFSDFPTYDRAAMTIEGYRQIVGDETFFAVARAIQIRFRHRNISTPDFIHVATRRSGLTGDRLGLLDEYFEQWLYGRERPDLLPERFD